MSARASVSIDFFADLACPWCYVGWSALKQAAASQRERAALTLVWRSFLLAPEAPLAGAPREPLPPQAAAALQQAMQDSGVAFDLDALTLIPNTLRAHRLVHLASRYRLGEAMIDALFDAYFLRLENIGEPDLLISLGEAAGLDPEEVSASLANTNFSDLHTMHEAALKIGVRGAPVAILNRKTVLMGAETVEAYANAIEAAL